MTLTPAFLDEVRGRTSLSALIERAVKLTKAGTEKKGCCPFHGEKTPSFYVNDDKGFYHCFGCSAHGDAIRWLTDHENMPFMDAVRQLANAAGMEMPARDSRAAERAKEHEEMLSVMRRAAEFYVDQWRGTDPVDVRGRDAAVDYLAKRGVPITAIDQFMIGYSPRTRRGEPSALAAALSDVASERLVALGLMKRGDDGSYFDFFRGRLMFAIRDARGRPIAFGGRVLGNGEPKYLNSPDTPVFDKGRTLFNVDRAAPAARRAGRLIVVEGYMDVIGLARAGIEEAVAPNGTALTVDQIAALWRIDPEPILCFDGDKAGRAAAARAALRALPLLEPGKSLLFVTPPEGQDPDDVARTAGKAGVDQLLAKPVPLVQVVWQHEVSAEPTDTPERVAGLKARLRAHVRSIRNADVREAYGQEIAKRFRAMIDAPAATSGPRRATRPAPTERQPFSRRPTPQSGASRRVRDQGTTPAIERAVLAGLLRYPDVARSAMEAVVCARLSSPAARALRDVIVDAGGAEPEIPAELEAAAHYAQTGPLRFSFTRDGVDPQQARDDLIAALDQIRD